MAFYMDRQSNRNDYNLKEYIADTVDDVDSLPTTCCPGSVCFVIEGSRVFMLNNQKEWKEI